MRRDFWPPNLRAFSLVAIAAFALGCRKPLAPETPENAYRNLGEAIRASDAARAFSLLSTQTRQRLEKRAEQIASASNGLIQNDPAVIFFQSGIAPGSVDTVEVLQQSAETATVVIRPSGIAVAMVREGDLWRVDLSTLFPE